MREYPRPIVAADFVDPIVVPPVAAPDLGQAARSVSDSPVINRRDRPHYRVSSLIIQSQAKPAFRSSSFSARDHADVARDGARFYFAPSAEHVTIKWEVHGPDVVVEAKLQLFVRGRAAPVWDRVLTPLELRTKSLDWDGRIPLAEQPDGEFPREYVSAAYSVYKLKLSVVGPPGAKCRRAEVWTYFDVRVAAIELAWGDPMGLAPARDDIAAPDQATILGFERQILGELDQVVQGANFQADQKVLLDMNRFQVLIEGSAARFSALRTRWGLGPRLPIVATVKLLKSDDTNTDAAPLAVAGAQIVWDWSDPRCEVAGHDQQRAEDWCRPNAAIETKQYLTDLFTRNRAALTPESFNCPVKSGGKHGDAAAPILQKPDGAQDADYVASPNRGWALQSRVAAAAVNSATPVWFRPSRIAGDTYQVRVYLLTAEQWEDADWGRPSPQLWQAAQAAHLPAAQSGRVEVRHKVDVRSFKTGGINYAQPDVKSIYEVEGGTELGIVEAALNEAQYVDAGNERAIVDYLLGEGLAGVSYPELAARVVNGAQTGMALAFRTAVTFDQDVDQLLNHQPLHTLTVNDAGAFAAVRETEALQAVAPGVWRGQIVDKRPPNQIDVLTLAGAQPPIEQLVSNATHTQFVPNASVANLAARAGMVNRVKPIVTGGYANLVPQFGFGAIGKPWAERRSTYYITQAALNDVAVMFLFDNLRSTDAFPSGTAYAEAGTPRLGVVAVGYPAPAPGAPPYKGAEAIIAHELGHSLFFAHAIATKLAPAVAALVGQPTWTPNFHQLVNDGNRAQLLAALNMPPPAPGTHPDMTALRIKQAAQPINAPPLEALEHQDSVACLMNYDDDSNHFCGLCMLKLRGWNISHRHGIDAPDGDVIFVPRPGRPTARFRVVLGSDGRTTGCDYTFRCEADYVSFYPVAVGGAAHPVAPGVGTSVNYTAAQIAAGVTLWVEASRPSGTANEVELKLEALVNPLGNLGADARVSKHRMTAVQVHLEVFHAKREANAVPAALTEDHKQLPGIFVHRQQAGRHGRVRVRVHQPIPNDLDCDLSLSSVGASLRILTADDARAGATGARAWGASSRLIPPQGQELFIQGYATSAAVGDTALELTIGAQVGDSVRATVVEITSVDVSVPATPVQRDRTLQGYAPARNPTVFTAQANWGVDFQPAQTLVLVSGSLTWDARAQLRVTMQPAPGELPGGVPIKWRVERASGDHEDHRNVVRRSERPVPALVYSTHTCDRAKLMADATGSFWVRAVVDPHGDGAIGQGGDPLPGFSLNLVLVKLEMTQNDSAAGSRVHTDPVGAGPQCTLNAGVFNHPDPRLRGINLSARIRAVGGGNDGRRGLAKLQCGWIQNIVPCRSNPLRSVRTADYLDLATNLHHAVDKIFVANNANMDYLPGGPVPVMAQLPILDGNLPLAAHNNHGAGGMRLSTSSDVDRRNKNPGLEIRVTANDSPNEAIETVKLPGHPSRVLQSMDWELCFSAYLCAWSTDADRAIGVLNQTDWDIRQSWRFDWTGNPPALVGGTAQTPAGPAPIANAPPALIVNVTGNVNGLTPAAQTTLEVGQPAVHHCQADDCRA
ncbi:hypothetical protein DB30_04879 [Enhygromyxa salina]|uniref:Uncharacterized protein n=1 Tax=Enhygromyxa salina TaxID=215803 RepID=A0A0C2CYX0_9BACT|nr:hypothetical protein [Enhygromyxa salina]KIG16161.1 hypothetical protein DB30_04879 [Enhygromyxa salina]